MKFKTSVARYGSSDRSRQGKLELVAGNYVSGFPYSLNCLYDWIYITGVCGSPGFSVSSELGTQSRSAIESDTVYTWKLFCWTFSSKTRILYGQSSSPVSHGSELLSGIPRIEVWSAAFKFALLRTSHHGRNMTGKSHSILDAVKHAVFEDEPEQNHTTAASAVSGPAFAQPSTAAVKPSASEASPLSTAIPIDSGTVPDDDAVYQRLLSKTNFETTDVASTIHKFLDPLKAIADSIMPPNVKFKTAVLQANAQAGLTGDSILAAFDNLKGQLQQEQSAFDDKARQFAGREISSRQERISQVSSQITDLQQELGKLSGELVEAQGKATHAQSQFAAAAQRRLIEIEQQRAQYASLLKG